MGKNPLKETVGYFEADSNLIDLFALNEFSENIEFLKFPVWDESIKEGQSVRDEDITELKYYISYTHGFEPNKYVLGEACYIIAKRKRYHPIKNYIEKEKWDGVERCDTWLIHSFSCDDNVYIRSASAKFMIAAVNRVYRPGCKFDHMLILEGVQGIYKSSIIEELASNWYLDTTFENKDKDLVDSIRTAFLVEISELSGMTKKDVDWLKSFLSKKVDRVRLAYAARTKDFQRKSVFIGTYNPSGNNMYLRDDTGNRRFWPVECKKMGDIQWIRENRNQLWAEALVRFKYGEQYYINDPDELAILAEHHAERELESPTHTRIKRWLDRKQVVTMEELIESALSINMNGKRPKDLLSYATTIGIIMRKLRWRKGTNDDRNKYYSPDYSEQETWDDSTLAETA